MTQLIVHNPTPQKEYAPRRERDFYPTPRSLACRVIECLWSRYDYTEALDPGAGTGVWGSALRDRMSSRARLTLTGVEINPELERPSSYDYWITANFLEWWTPKKFNLILGNPPFSLAEPFIRRALTLLEPGGKVVFLLTLEFLGSQKRHEGLWKTHPPAAVYVLPRRPSFTGDRKTDGREYAVFEWTYRPAEITVLKWMPWRYDDE